MKQILITGAGGYLGSELIRQLLQTEHQVVALTSDKLKIKQKYGDAVNCYSNDEFFSNKMPFRNVDVVIHCAFARNNDAKEIVSSLHFTKEIFTIAANKNINVINISSRSVYGQNPETPWHENTEINPDSLYALGKFTTEILADTIIKDKALYCSIRLAGLLAPDFDDRIVNKFITNTILGKNIKIVGGKQQFAFLDIRDAAEGIIKLLETDAVKWEKVYNLGYLKSYTIQEIAGTVKQVAEGFNYEVEIIKEPSDAVLYAELDSTRFYRDTGWKPGFDMSATVKSIFKSKLKGS